MDTAADPMMSAILAGYAPQPGVADELFDAEGRMRPVWSEFIGQLAALTPDEVEARFAGREVPRPPGWSGFRVLPSSFEFWHGAGFRLHERWRYERAADGGWSKRMLFP